MSSPAPAARVTNQSPFAAMLRSSFGPSALVGLLCVVIFFVLHGVAGGVSALFGALLALGFFASGLFVLSKVRNLNSIAIMAAGMAVFFGQIIALGLILLAARQVESLDGPATGITVLVVVLAWQVFQVRSFQRTRQFVYDPDASQGRS